MQIGIMADIIESHSLAGFREFKPILPDNLVEALWTHHTPLNFPKSKFHYLVPDPAVNIILTRQIDELGAMSEEKIELHGSVTKRAIFNLTPGCELIGIRLKPECLPWLLNITSSDIFDLKLDLRSIAPELEERLFNLLTSSPTTYVLKKLYKSIENYGHIEKKTSPVGIRAIEIIRRSRGQISQKKLSALMQISDRHLRRAVQNVIGISPQKFARTIRFINTLVYVDSIEKPDWSDCANHFGYFDQAHLINDFKSFTELTPIQLYNSRKAESDYSNI